MRKLALDCVEPSNRAYIQLILSYQVHSDPDFLLAPNIALASEHLVQDPIMDAVMDRSFEFYLMDSADYSFSQVKRISSRTMRRTCCERVQKQPVSPKPVLCSDNSPYIRCGRTEI